MMPIPGFRSRRNVNPVCVKEYWAMKKTWRTAVACLALLLSSGTIISGHHSQAVFDLDNQITLEGRIVQVNWGNPHSLFFLEGKKVGEPDSQIKKWAMEGPSPTSLTRSGWTQDVLKTGDQSPPRGTAAAPAGR
jgi:hypothetical protein